MAAGTACRWGFLTGQGVCEGNRVALVDPRHMVWCKAGLLPLAAVSLITSTVRKPLSIEPLSASGACKRRAGHVLRALHSALFGPREGSPSTHQTSFSSLRRELS